MSPREEMSLDLPLALTIDIATYGRCYFQAASGDQGLCYPTTLTGDEIWVLDGDKVPFILRPTLLIDEERTAPTPCYELIGDCYFDGFINAEAIHDIRFRAIDITLI
jgi:hypothetical protein